MKIKNLIIAVTVFAVMAAAGCGRTEAYGEKILNHNITPMKDIFMHPENYNGKTVTVKGKIAIECETGCWFNLKEEGASIYTDLQPSGFAIPQKAGRIAIVEGNILVKNGMPTLVGKGVEIQ